MTLETPPLVLVLAGPNGAGKSTAASTLIPDSVPFLNADEIAKTLPDYPSPRVDLLAGKHLIHQIDALEERRRGFAVETTLAGRTLAARLARLRGLGYTSELIFLWTPSPEFSIQRVAERVRLGGHSIPEDVIRRRWRQGLENFFRLYLTVSDVWRVYSNLDATGFQRVAEGGIGMSSRVYDETVWRAICERVSDAERFTQPGPEDRLGEGA